MNSLTISVYDLSTVMEVFDSIQLRRYSGSEDIPSSSVTDTIVATEYTSVSGIDVINNRTGVSNILLDSSYSTYYFTDPDGNSDDWYTTRYYNTTTLSTSGWSSPVQAGSGELYHSIKYPDEVDYNSEDQLIIDKIRLYIGDPINLNRDYGEEAKTRVHSDGKIYELEEYGWPVYVNVGGQQFSSSSNPVVNGYKFLKFDNYIDDECDETVTYSGVCGDELSRDITNGIDIWYYTFRHSDRQIMDAYDSCLPPTKLTISTATSEAYMLQTSIDLLRKELWEDATEDGAKITDDDTSYDPSPGLKVRQDLLDDLIKRLDDLVQTVMLAGIEGVRID